MQTLTFEQIPSYLFELGEAVKNIERQLGSVPGQSPIEEPQDVETAAAFVHLEVPTMYTLVQKRRIPHHRQGKKLYFFKSELVEWIKEGRANTTTTLHKQAEESFLAANKKGGHR